MIAARILISFSLVFLLSLSELAYAAAVVPSVSGEEPVDLEADQLSFDDQAGRYLASGHVRLKQGDLELRSDELWWHRDSGDINATGNVVLAREQERLSGKRLHYNLNDETGFVEDGDAFLAEQNLRVSGARIEKRGVSDYRIIDGSFTTCEGDVPAWKFNASQLDLTVGGYARAWNTIFYLKGLPSFYVPYMIYPAKTERESGLLIPSVGYSDRRGMEYSGAYYQVISRNQDATFYLDYLSNLGLGKGLEYRYVFSRDNAGEARGYHVSAEEGEDRQAFSWDHRGTLPGQIRLSADTEYVSALDYFDDFGEDAGEYNKDQSVSIVSLSRNWGLNNLVGQLRYTKNLKVDDPTTLQWLPRISFDSVRQRIGASPFYFASGSEYTNFWREEGLKGQRIRVRPALLATYTLWDAINVMPEVGWNERHYWTSGDQSNHEQSGFYDFSTRLSSRFYRVYPWETGSVDRVRHMLEPDISFIYVPDVDQEMLPEFDSFDRIDETEKLEYGLTQRLTTKLLSGDAVPEYRELLFFRLSQSYDLLPNGGSSARFSALRGQLLFDPYEFIQFSSDSSYDFDRGRWDKYSVETSFHDQRGNRLRLEYRNRRTALDEEAIDYGSLRLELALLKPVYLGYLNRYDFETSRQLEQVLDLEYRHQCWGLFVTLRDRDDEKSVMLSFSLGGIGRVGSSGRTMGGS